MTDFLVFEGISSISAILARMQSAPSDCRKIYKILFDRSRVEKKYSEFRFLEANASTYGYSFETVDAGRISALAVGKTHGGVLALCGDRTIPCLSSLSLPEKGVYYLLDGVEDPFNLGNSIRSLYASGCNGLVLTETDRLTQPAQVAKSSAGASERMNLYKTEDITSAIAYFKSAGYTVYSTGIRDSESLYDITFSEKSLILIGGEKRGISRKVLDQCDHIIRIPYGSDFNGSLSSSATAAVVSFELFRQKAGK